MTRRDSNRLGMAALLCAGQLLALAQPVQAATNRAAGFPLPPPPELALPPVLPKSPISFFRELLAMNAAEREQALTNRPPESQARILAKVREYEALPANDRELRLQVTELRWYLLPLLSAPATNRAALMGGVPQRHRALVEDRLREWDKLAPEARTELLENQATLQYLSEIEGRTGEQRREVLKSIPPARREMLEKGIARWDSMSGDERRRMLGRFNQFFDLTLKEREKALQTLSGPERRQIQKTLETFGRLPSEQRAACIRSFAKFASLSQEERRQFLKNAERWQQMSPKERQTWRDLVRLMPPPLPPLPPPPVPPKPAPTIVTKGN